jgi:hypothetical protein
MYKLGTRSILREELSGRSTEEQQSVRNMEHLGTRNEDHQGTVTDTEQLRTRISLEQ